MSHYPMHRFPVFAIIALFCSLQYANGGVISQSFGVGGSLESPNSVTLRKFDSSIGSLNGVALSLELFATTHFTAASESPDPPIVSFFELASSATVGTYLDQDLDGRGLAVFVPGIGTLDEPEPIGLGFGFLQGQSTVLLSDFAVIDDFISTDAGDLEVEVPIGIGVLVSPNLEIQGIGSTLTGRLKVDYLFDQVDQGPPQSADGTVPEPTSIAVLGLGAVVMLGSRRRRSNRRR